MEHDTGARCGPELRPHRPASPSGQLTRAPVASRLIQRARDVVGIVAEAFFAVVSVFVIMEVGSRRIVHVNVKANPTLAWVKQQVREATAWDQTPRFLVHDNDGIFGQFGTPVASVMFAGRLRSSSAITTGPGHRRRSTGSRTRTPS